MSKIQNWPFFGQKRPKFGHFWQQKKTKIILCFDLILTLNFFRCNFLYEIFLVKYFFHIFVCHADPCDQFLPFEGSFCFKISPKSTLIEPFDLFITEKLFHFLFSYEIRIVDCLFTVFFVTLTHVNNFWVLSGGRVVKKHQNSSKSTFLESFGLCMTGNVF